MTARGCRLAIRLGITAWCCLLVTPGDAAAQSAERLLVVPFENVSREAQSYWLTEASAVILTDDLIALGAPTITREDRVRAFERLRVPAAATLSHATVIRLGQLVGAGVAVVGSVEVKGQNLTVRARSIRIDVGRMAPEIVESGPLAEVFAVYARVARQLAPGSRVTAEEMEQGHQPIAAFEQYIKGLLAHAPASKIAFLSQALRIIRRSTASASSCGTPIPTCPNTGRRWPRSGTSLSRIVSRGRRGFSAPSPWCTSRNTSRRSPPSLN